MGIFETWLKDERRCRKCGCTENNACTVQSPFGGAEDRCAWVEEDLCSGCAEPQTLIRGPVRPLDCRWTAARKEALLTKIQSGELTIDVALVRFGLTSEELAGWDYAHKRYGQNGLCAGRSGRSR